VPSDPEGARCRRRRPLYQQTAEELKELILSGECGDVLPSQDRLSEVLQVSRPTIREAIRLLERGGIVRSVQGVGTVIQRNTPLFRPGLEELFSTTELINRGGYNPGTTFLDVSHTTATHDKYPAFAGTPVLVVKRVRTANDKPFVYSVDVIPDLGYDLKGLREAVGEGSLIAWLQARNVEVSYATTAISARVADQELAERLAVRPGNALLFMQETGYSRDHKPVYYSNDYYRTDLVEFRVVRRRSTG